METPNPNRGVDAFGASTHSTLATQEGLVPTRETTKLYPQHRGDRGARKSEPSGSEAKRKGILLNSVPTTEEMAVGAHADREVQQGERAPRTREHPSPMRVGTSMLTQCAQGDGDAQPKSWRGCLWGVDPLNTGHSRGVGANERDN